MAETGAAAQYAGHPKPNQLFREPSKPSWTTRSKPSIIELECEKSSIEMLEVIYINRRVIYTQLQNDRHEKHSRAEIPPW